MIKIYHRQLSEAGMAIQVIYDRYIIQRICG